MRHTKFPFLSIFVFLSACAGQSAPFPQTIGPSPAFATLPPTWTSLPLTPTPAPPIETNTPSPAAAATMTLPATLTATSTLAPAEIAAELATRMVAEPSPTPMLACLARATGNGLPLAAHPFGRPGPATMVPDQDHEITAWHSPLLYISLNGKPQGWVRIPREGLELSGASCMPEGHTDLEDLYGYPNVCLFLAISGTEPPIMYRDTSLESATSFQVVIGYFLGQKGDYYSITFSEAGPTGYVLKSSGLLVGDCP